MRTLLLITVLMLAVPSAVTLAAADGIPKKDEKDLCLLYAEKCAQRADSILEKIGKLKTEIEKGEKIYSPDELKRLERKLQEYEYFLNDLLYRNTH